MLKLDLGIITQFSIVCKEVFYRVLDVFEWGRAVVRASRLFSRSHAEHALQQIH